MCASGGGADGCLSAGSAGGGGMCSMGMHLTEVGWAVFIYCD